MNRGKRRGKLFLEDVDRHDFIKTRLELVTSKSARAILHQWLRQHAKPGPKRRKSIKVNHTMGDSFSFL